MLATIIAAMLLATVEGNPRQAWTLDKHTFTLEP